MSLFTSLSRRHAWVFIVSFIVAVPASWSYTLWGNPEMRLNRKILAVKRSWIAEMRRESPSITVISGGSSPAFQIDTDLLHKEFGAHVCNTGLAAGLGLDGTVAYSSTFLKKGDRLLLMTEPPLLGEGGGELTAMAGQVLFLTGHRGEIFFQKKLGPLSSFDFLLKCRPGLTHCISMAGKLLLRKPLFRYRIEEFGRDGFASTSVRIPLGDAGSRVMLNTLTPQGRDFLKELKTWADAREIEVIYLLPVSYIAPDRLEEQREINRRFLQEIGEIIPVWNDVYMGCSSDPADFADTSLHMTKTAAQERTRVLGQSYGQLLRSGNSGEKM